MDRGGLGEVFAQLLVDGELARAAGFGVLQDHVADVGQLDVARVEDLNAEHFVARGDGAQRAHPVDRAEEVTDDDRHSAAAFRTTQCVDRDRQIPAHPDWRLGMVAMVRSIVCSCCRPDRAGTRVIFSPLAISAPSRFPPPLLRKVMAAAAATAKSRFSQTAVPKSRLADMSTTSQVSSSRSAIICRTCG